MPQPHREDNQYLCSGCDCGQPGAGPRAAGSVPEKLGSDPRFVTESLYNPGQFLEPLCASVSSSMVTPDLFILNGEVVTFKGGRTTHVNTLGKVPHNLIMLIMIPGMVPLFKDYQDFVDI